jgi:hypothetical protein
LRAVVRLAVERFAVDRFAVVRLAVVRLAVERFAVERFAVERLAVVRFAVVRLAVERFAVVRLAVERLAVVRLAVVRFAVDRFAVVRRVPVERAVLLRRVPVERLRDAVVVLRAAVVLDLLLAVAMCLLLVGEFGGNNYWRSMSVAPAVIQQKRHLSYLEMSSTTFPVCSSDACLATSACATIPMSLPSSSTTGSLRTW